MKKIIKLIIKPLVPKIILSFRANLAEKKRHSLYKNLPMSDIFKKIYKNNEWGVGDGEFFSGSGTHNNFISQPYIKSVREFLKSFDDKPILVDIGSGDFKIGSNFVDLVKYYYACDIVSDLQDHNTKVFDFSNVSFLSVDATIDDIPNGDILVIRQVLQHLSNDNIKKIINKCNKFRYWIVTEHISNIKNFTPNKDITTGSGIRVLINSGVVITEPPFNLSGFIETKLCESHENGGIIRTILYEKK